MNLLLHTPKNKSELFCHYHRAFANAIELFIVTAYLTEWDTSLKLNPDCRSFQMIIGKDFGITRKAACETVMRWLPPERKGQFLVADRINGFHPKAVFWKEANGNCFAIIGSSNLTRAAFETNFEANIYCNLPATDYVKARQWVKRIEQQSVVVSEDWLMKYKEAPSAIRGQPPGTPPLVALNLPEPHGMEDPIGRRRKQLIAYEGQRAALIRLFRRCASGEISSEQFYNELPNYWSYDLGNRLQGQGWERQGRSSDFQALAQSFVRILEAPDENRDDVVVEEIDRLDRLGVATRKAFLSEMLCLRFPEHYPVLNQPVRAYLQHMEYEALRGASEGSRYVDLARRFRFSLQQNPDHPAKNLAELDTVIWLEYGNHDRHDPTGLRGSGVRPVRGQAA